MTINPMKYELRHIKNDASNGKGRLISKHLTLGSVIMAKQRLSHLPKYLDILPAVNDGDSQVQHRKVKR